MMVTFLPGMLMKNWVNIASIPGYDAVNSGSAVSYHEDELPVGEQLNAFKVIINS